MGGHQLIAMDYVGPEVEDDDVRMSPLEMTRNSVRRLKNGAFRLVGRTSKSHDAVSSPLDIEKDGAFENAIVTEVSALDEKENDADGPYPPHLAHRRVAFHADERTLVLTSAPSSSRVCSPAPTEHGLAFSSVTAPAPTALHEAELPSYPSSGFVTPVNPIPASPSSQSHASLPSRSRHPIIRVLRILRVAILSLVTPPAMSIIIAFPIALIKPLKALFVPIPNSPIPNAPDGQPPLAFILDTATFIGGASVPLGLICLGSALARLKLPRGSAEWRALPIGAINGLAVGKMLVMPVLGVLITEGLVSCGLIGKEERVLRFVCMFVFVFAVFDAFCSDIRVTSRFFSCVPTATTQVCSFRQSIRFRR